MSLTQYAALNNTSALAANPGQNAVGLSQAAQMQAVNAVTSRG